MNRSEIENLALSIIDKTKCLILELITGYGKTKIAIDLINHICDRVYVKHQDPTNILILVAKTVHKQTWKDEIKKWGGIKSDNVIIECYESFKKYKNGYFDVVIADEVQHLSEARRDILDSLHINEAFIGLSATIKKEMKEYFRDNYKAHIIRCGLKEAVQSDILPEPDVYLVPMSLSTTGFSFKINKFGQNIITTQRGYYNTLSSMILWYKNNYMRTRSRRLKLRWLSMAGERLKWLSEQKEGKVLSILDYFKGQRTLTFCSSIDQAERLGKYNITSKNKNSIDYLNMFNSNKIKHITACSILNEGVNLTNCRIGIFCNLNSSEIISKQRVGRVLRHKKPIIILPYFKDTREEELVEKMTAEYNKDHVFTIHNLFEIKL